MEDIFRITIGSASSTGNKTNLSDNLNHDIQLIKAALLYSDKVEVCSPLGNLINSVNWIRQMSISAKIDDKVKLLQTVLTYLARPELAKILDAFTLLKKKKHLSGKEIVLEKQFVKEIQRIWEEFQKKDFNLVEGDKLNEILKLCESELIKYFFFDVSQENVRDDLVKQFSNYIANAISDPYSYPLLDDLSGAFISEQILFGEIKISKSDINKSKHVQLAADLFERIPHFDLASVDEILDIKKELSPYLIKFRSGMINLSKLINISQWSNDFEKEVEVIFRSTIEPAISEIEDIIKTKTYLKSLVSRFVDKPHVFPIPLFGIALAGQLSNLGVLSIIVDGLLLGANLYDIHNQLEKEKLSLKQNQLFFYYKVKKMLS